MTRAERPFEPEVKLAIERYNRGDAGGACEILRRLLRRYPDVAAIHGYLAGYQYFAGDYEGALPHARKAVALAPHKPTPARELFLVLFSLRWYSEALNEALRFRPHADSDELVQEWDSLLCSARSAMSSYEEAFPKGTRVKVRGREFLQQFAHDWGYHHPLQHAQLLHAGVTATVAGVSFFHGGSALYELQGIEGLWHEACLTDDDDTSAVPGSTDP